MSSNLQGFDYDHTTTTSMSNDIKWDAKNLIRYFSTPGNGLKINLKNSSLMGRIVSPLAAGV